MIYLAITIVNCFVSLKKKHLFPIYKYTYSPNNFQIIGTDYVITGYDYIISACDYIISATDYKIVYYLPENNCLTSRISVAVAGKEEYDNMLLSVKKIKYGSIKKIFAENPLDYTGC